MGAAVIGVLAILAVGVVLTAVSSARGSTVTAPTGVAHPRFATTPATPTLEKAGGRLFVHVLGRVAKAGLYEVEPDARVIDVVTAAGGFTPGADQGAVNLARPVTDGEQIVVPAVGDPAQASGPPGARWSSEGAPAEGGGAGSPPVDLNSADEAALESLSGVGPATAEAIVAWREEHGRFESVEDLLDVTGIGEKKLEGMRDQVVAR